MGESMFGAIYAMATVLSSVLLLTIGHSIDHKPVKKVTVLTLFGLSTSCLLLGTSHLHLSVLFVSLMGLRLFGQGMLTHISQTVMARFYIDGRGKALSISTLGFSLGEALFPFFVSLILLNWGYERAAQVSSGFLLVCTLLVLFAPLDHFNNASGTSTKDSPSFKETISLWGAVLRDKNFLVLMPASFVLSFTSTSVFFYQYVFVEDKGWSPSLYAIFFTVYAITRFLMSIAGGVWVDTYSGVKMFRVYLIPMALGLVPFALIDHISGALLFLISAGISVGMAGTIKSATLAELYGVGQLGAIRSLFTMFMVLSTALGPLLVGFLLDKEIHFTGIILGLAVLMLMAIINAQRLKRSN